MVSRPRTRGASHLALPLAFDGQDQGVIAVECQGVTETSLREAMRQLQWGVAWIELHQRRSRAASDATRLRQGYAALEVARHGARRRPVRCRRPGHRDRHGGAPERLPRRHRLA